MKIFNYLTNKTFAGALGLAMITLASSAMADMAPQVVTVVRVEGHARYSVDNKSWQKLSRGDVLKPGAVIQTAEKSQVDLLMGEHVNGLGMTTPVTVSTSSGGGGGGMHGPQANIVRVFASSVLSIDKLVMERTGVDEVSETQLDLRAGRIMGNVKKLSGGSRYEVKIPNGVAGIRGTIYIVDANGTVWVIEGEVIISYYDSKGVLYTKDIYTGQSFSPFNPDGTVGPGVLSNFDPNNLPPPIQYNPQITTPPGVTPIIRLQPPTSTNTPPTTVQQQQPPPTDDEPRAGR